MKIIKTVGVVTKIVELSSSAREIHIESHDELDFIAGCFVNLFVDCNGKKERRAYSISSDANSKKKFSITVRKKIGGLVSPMFWDEDIIGKEFEIMGPLGLNTVDKMKHSKVYLFAFGVGVSVIRSVLYSLLSNDNVESVYIVTGSRNENEILYTDFFTTTLNSKIKSVKNVVSDPIDSTYPFIGYIQNHVEEYDFNNSDIYICGMKIACNQLEETIKKHNPIDSEFFIEDFH